MLVTVAICTWNRAQLLDQTLTQMAQLRIPDGVQWELLVVNNACTDDTDAVLARHSSRLPLRRLFEPKQGHCNARNCALEAAAGELLLWTDDDVLLPSDWIGEYVKAATQFPKAAMLGGPIKPWFPVAPPSWISEHWNRLRSTWAILDQGDRIRPLRAGESIYGANMGMRTAVASRYRFNTNLGRKGPILVSGDEMDFMERLLLDGHDAVWIGTGPVEHYIPAERLTTQYVWELHRCNCSLHVWSFPDSLLQTSLLRLRLLKYSWTLWVQLWLWSMRKDEKWLEALLESARVQAMRDALRERIVQGSHA